MAAVVPIVGRSPPLSAVINNSNSSSHTMLKACQVDQVQECKAHQARNSNKRPFR